jgi:hypothetical protein
VEPLEAREVPANLAWTNAMGNGLSTTAGNWWNLDTGATATSAPAAGDSLFFDGSVSNNSVYGLIGFGLSETVADFASIQFVNNYSGTVNVAPDSSGGLSVGSFTLSSGAIAQPYFNTNLTVLSSFTWTGGTLNSSSNLATVTLSGATGTFAPAGGGTVELGSDITLANGAEATMREGTVDMNKSGIQFITTTGSRFHIDPGTLKQAIFGLHPLSFGLAMQGTSWTVDTGIVKFGGAMGNGGTVTLMPDVSLSVLGNTDTHEGYVQWGGAATYLHGDSVLASLNEPVLIQGGILATVWAPSVGSANATIVSPTVKVSGGDIYAGQQQGLHVNFGVLFVDGNVEWSGGTFHPHVYADGQTRDVWMTVTDHYAGTFTITGGTIAPIYLDLDYGTSSFPTSGAKWQVLMAQGGFTNNTAPSVDDPLWMMQIDPMNPPKYWELVAN